MKEAGVRLLSLHSSADPAQDTAARTLSAIEGRRHSLDGSGEVSSAPSTARSKEQSAAAIGASIQAAKDEADWLDKNRLRIFLDMPAEHHLASIQRIALWQNVVSYLLHFVMILNILITAFGITGNQRQP